MCEIFVFVHADISTGEAIPPIGTDFVKQYKSMANRNSFKS